MERAKRVAFVLGEVLGILMRWIVPRKARQRFVRWVMEKNSSTTP